MLQRHFTQSEYGRMRLPAAEAQKDMMTRISLVSFTGGMKSVGQLRLHSAIAADAAAAEDATACTSNGLMGEGGSQ